ncbi:MAG: glycosyltransferase [Hyphomicrobiaceae bacterium]
MRVLHVVPSYYPAVRYGGPIYSVHGLAKSLAERGHDVNVFTTNADGDDVLDVPLGTDVNLDNVNIRYFPCGIGRRIFRSPALAATLKATIATVDIVHLHSVFLYPTLVASRTAAAAGVPYVLSPRGMLVEDLIQKKSRLAKRIWISLFERRTIAMASAIHSTSAHETEELERLGLALPKIIEIPNGIDLPDTGALSEHRRSTTERPYILSLGRISWKKGLSELIRAMVHVPDADLVIAGNDEENYTAKLQALVRDVGIEDRVKFHGPVQGHDKWRLLSQATLFAMPSQSENFGNSALEAMAYAVPVVVSPGVGLAAHIQRTVSGVVVPSDPEELGRALCALMRDPTRRELMGQAGRHTAAQDFAWRGIAASFEELYSGICGPR